MSSQFEAAVDCPYCGERIVILVDPSIADQAYVEDCAVCCQPMAVRAAVGTDGVTWVEARREDET